jgi:hypothetical protein
MPGSMLKVMPGASTSWLPLTILGPSCTSKPIPVYHRLDAIERATGIDLTTGGGRLTLHLALELAPYVSAPSDRGK